MPPVGCFGQIQCRLKRRVEFGEFDINPRQNFLRHRRQNLNPLAVAHACSNADSRVK